MPTSLPVPSKGALRALRTLALGTSCTVAVGAGLLTEDRRRRIHTARQVYENAQTLKSLKSSRRCHSADLLEYFEEKALQQGEDACWLPSNVARTRSIAASTTVAEENIVPAELVPRNSIKPSTPVPSAIHNRTILFRPLLDNSTTEKEQWTTSYQPPTCLHPIGLLPPKPLLILVPERQRKLALEMEFLLSGPDEQVNLEAAMSLFLNTFENEIMTVAQQGLCPELVEAAGKLFGATGKRFDLREKILQVISSHGPVDQTRIQQFRPVQTMSHMMKRVRGKDGFVDIDLLKKVVSIYQTTFPSRPVFNTDQLYSLGRKLCATTCEVGLYRHTIKLFVRLSSIRGERPRSCVEHLIEAIHARRNPQQNWRYFKLLYTKTSPDQLGLFKTGNLVLNSLLMKDPSKLEEFLGLVTRMAESNHILASTTWFLKTLGHDWRTNQDITRTRAMFERMIPLISHTAHPEAVYSAIIQFCIQAKSESVALDYYKQLSEKYPEASQDVRILGHLAYAKALRGDWNGVREDLQAIHDQKPVRNSSEQEDFSALFTPILNIFPNSHTLSETEEFLRMAIDGWHLKITPYISNTMIGAYYVSKEIDSIIRWLDMTASVGCPIDASTINVVFKKLARHWDFDFLELYRLYIRIRDLDKRLGTKSTNGDTLLLLEKIAISASQNDEKARKNLGYFNNISLSSLPNFASGPERLYRDMVRAYVHKDYDTVLEMYSTLKDSTISVQSKHLGMAVKATLKSNGQGLKEAVALIKHAEDDGLDVADSVAILMIRRIEMLDEQWVNVHEIANMIFNDLESLFSRSIKVPESVVTHIMSVLIRRGQYKSAIDVWGSMSSLSQNQSGPDLITLTVLLRAYIGVQFKNGIRWAVHRLSEQKIAPDAYFLLVLTIERGRLRREIGRGMSNTTKSWVECIDRAIEQVRAISLALREEKTDVKSTTFQVLEVAAEQKSASLSANLIGARKDAQVWSTESSVAMPTIQGTNFTSSPAQQHIVAEQQTTLLSANATGTRNGAKFHLRRSYRGVPSSQGTILTIRPTQPNIRTRDDSQAPLMEKEFTNVPISVSVWNDWEEPAFEASPEPQGRAMAAASGY